MRILIINFKQLIADHGFEVIFTHKFAEMYKQRCGGYDSFHSLTKSADKQSKKEAAIKKKVVGKAARTAFRDAALKKVKPSDSKADTLEASVFPFTVKAAQVLAGQ